jgi:hypothetical protein
MDMTKIKENNPQTSAEQKKGYLGAGPDLMICTVKCKIGTKKEKVNKKEVISGHACSSEHEM